MSRSRWRHAAWPSFEANNSLCDMWRRIPIYCHPCPINAHRGRVICSSLCHPQGQRASNSLALSSILAELLRNGKPVAIKYRLQKTQPMMSLTARRLHGLAQRRVRWNSTSGTEQAAKENPLLSPLSLLQRPLGVRDRPLAHTRTWEDTRKDLMDEDTRLKQRDHLYVVQWCTSIPLIMVIV